MNPPNNPVVVRYGIGREQDDEKQELVSAEPDR
jgi:hypothetical protein